ncbi:MAG: hypothetical protein GX817_06690, partial [Elusimicrobia bacterium]|nr:hypothetical protein [Elusimicrobiota bacterium]
MKKTIINSLLVIVVGVLIYTGIYQFIRLNVSSQKNEDSPISKVIETKTINVNGTLYYPAEKPDGYYTVWWMSTPRIHAAGNPIRSEDGEFSVDFFQNTGELVLMLGYSENPDPFAPSMALAEVPV